MATISEYIQRWRNKEISGTQLVRLLVSYPQWILPVSESAAAEMIDTNAASRLQYNCDAQGVNRLMMFSSPESFTAYRQKSGQQNRGQHFLTTTGVWVFGMPLEGIDEIWIDPLTADGILYSKAQFELLRKMAAAVEVEQALAALRQGTAPDAAVKVVKNYSSYWAPVGIQGENMRLMLAPDDQGRKLAALFTSEETLAAFLPQVRAFVAPEQVVERIFKGEDLFSILMKMPIDGMVFNCGGGPVSPVAFAKGFAQIVSEA